MNKIVNMKLSARRLGLSDSFPTTLKLVGEGNVSFSASCFKDKEMEVYIDESRVCYPKNIIDDYYE